MFLIPFIVGLFAITGPKSAGPLTWEVPAECPDREALTQAIELRIGRPFADGAVGLVGTISQGPGDPPYLLNLELTSGGRSHTHTLPAEHCDSLVNATVFLVALASTAVPGFPNAHPGAFAGRQPVRKAAVQKPDPAAKPELSEPKPTPPAVVEKLEAPAPLAAKSGRPGVLVRVQGGPEFGAVPGVTGAVGLAVGPLWRRARLEVQGLYIAPRSVTRESQMTTHDKNTLEMSLFTGAVVGCGRLGRRRLEVPLCGGLELGGVRWTATGPEILSGPATRIWLAGTVTAAVAWHAGRRLTFMLALHGLAHVFFPDFKRNGERLFAAKPVSGRLFLGLELRFGDPW